MADRTISGPTPSPGMTVTGMGRPGWLAVAAPGAVALVVLLTRPLAALAEASESIWLLS
ncbi:MAG: hypothetical protein ACP5VP_04910 [Candidatus Limnocylindrales bacterium]